MMNVNNPSAVYSEWRLKHIWIGPVVLICLGLMLISLGIVSQFYNNTFEYISQRYDDQCNLVGQGNPCKIEINVSKDMHPPNFVSFELSSFFQNTDAYYRSISYEQLKGQNNYNTGHCWPYVTNAQLNKLTSVNGTPLDPEATAIPCGMVAYTYMNDTYTIDGYNIVSTGIAWDSDMDKFNNIDLSRQWIDMTDERFINWVRISALSRLRKLWGRIDETIVQGKLTITITMNYMGRPDSIFDLNKYILIHNDKQYDDPILVVTIPCLCMGVFMVILGGIVAINQMQMRTLSYKYKLV